MGKKDPGIIRVGDKVKILNPEFFERCGEDMKIPLSKQRMTPEIYEGVEEVLKSGWWTMGKYTEQLEDEFSKYIGVKYAVAVNSCSMALFLCLEYYNFLGGILLEGSLKNRLIATTPLTFCSTVNAIIYAGARPILFDVNKTNQCIDLDSISDYDAKYIWGCVPVHFGGCPCDIDRLGKLTEVGNWKVVQDCAHAVETKWGGINVGVYGNASCYSFNPTKNIAAPEMGMVATNNEYMAKCIRRARIHGMDCDASKRVTSPGSYTINHSGYKANPTDMEAVIALHQLRMVKENWERRLEISVWYRDAFVRFYAKGWFNGNIPIVVSKWPDGMRHGLHLFQIHINNRDKFIARMRESGIYCGVHYKPIHLHPYYRGRVTFGGASLENAEWIGEHTCSLPLGPGMTEEDVEYIINSIEDIIKGGGYLF